MPLRIYSLHQISWNKGRMTDFDLPKLIGVYSTMNRAIQARAVHIVQFAGRIEAYTTPDDYKIAAIDVID